MTILDRDVFLEVRYLLVDGLHHKTVAGKVDY